MSRYVYKVPTVRCCKVCEITKPITDYPTNRNKAKNTYRHRCIDCEKLYVKEVNRKNYVKRINKINDNNINAGTNIEAPNVL